ncbi:N-acetyltransferase [Pontibacter sp. E15-1]|uniref:GNAT family N-acetyltransferase n=1 Tax=Pontibacter sp. E15-1 TaxID=2919918 RepID=UPI001F4F6727|nr:N-acetyltransferase [Pontibacter sp. E15-1]MCJ8166295.1 N-acetyltransferase [Pontibacter sp. E15-1]
MNILIRHEKPTDHIAVFELIKDSFGKEEFSDHREHFLVERLRESDSFIQELSLVAEVEGKIVGHILLTKIKIKNTAAEFVSLALAPVSVIPEFQNMGIGGMLIAKAHEIARKMGYTSVVVLGHENYYPRFGYRQAHTFGIESPFDVPKENFMAIELIDNGLKGISGKVEYPEAFTI